MKKINCGGFYIDENDFNIDEEGKLSLNDDAVASSLVDLSDVPDVPDDAEWHFLSGKGTGGEPPSFSWRMPEGRTFDIQLVPTDPAEPFAGGTVSGTTSLGLVNAILNGYVVRASLGSNASIILTAGSYADGAVLVGITTYQVLDGYVLAVVYVRVGTLTYNAQAFALNTVNG